jgi:hypothetical protein
LPREGRSSQSSKQIGKRLTVSFEYDHRITGSPYHRATESRITGSPDQRDSESRSTGSPKQQITGPKENNKRQAYTTQQTNKDHQING